MAMDVQNKLPVRDRASTRFTCAICAWVLGDCVCVCVSVCLFRPSLACNVFNAKSPGLFPMFKLPRHNGTEPKAKEKVC